MSNYDQGLIAVLTNIGRFLDRDTVEYILEREDVEVEDIEDFMEYVVDRAQELALEA